MKNTLLFVGNGFTTSLLRHLKLNIDTTNPFNWKIKCLDPNVDDLLNYLSWANEFVQTCKKQKPGINDFEILANLAEIFNSTDINEDIKRIHCELRHFIALAFSNFQICIDTFNFQGWEWLVWLNNNRQNLLGAISFNYDLILERALSQANIKFYRPGVVNESFGVPILKPHGSIDFEAIGISIEPPSHRLANITFLNHCELYRLDQNWLIPRQEADIVLPSEPSPQTKLRFVKEGIRTFDSISSKVQRCVVVGLSYCDVDKSEINYFLDQLPSDCQIELVNPDQQQELIGRTLKKNVKRVWPAPIK